MNSIVQSLSMGSYGVYVWSAYGLTGLMLLLGWLSVRCQCHQTRKILKQWFGRQ